MYHTLRIIRQAPQFILKFSALAVALPCALATAQDPSSGGSLGLGIARAPVYQGSDVYKSSAMPMLEYHWESGLFVGGTGLIGMQFSKSPELQYGVVLGADGGRKETDSRYLKGLGDIAGRGTLGAFVKTRLSDSISLSAAYTYGSGKERKGGLLDLGLGFDVPVSQAVSLSLGVGATLANASYMQNYFGVSAAQSSASGYAVYKPSGGLRDVSLNLGLNYQINPQWSLASGITFTALSDAAKKSPLVRKTNSTSAFVGAVYTF